MRVSPALTGPRRDQFGHMRLRALLAREAFDPVFRGAPLLAQFSSMGSLTGAWLDELRASLAAGRVEGGSPGAPAGADLHGLLSQVLRLVALHMRIA